jgi:hypothetical protein
MEKEKSVKLALISMLSNPDIKIIDIHIENDLQEMPNDNGWENKVPNGTSHYQINIYNKKNDKRDI